MGDGCGSGGVGQLRHAHGVWGRSRGTPVYAGPEELWVEWLRPVGEALEGREEEVVVVEGGIWCRFDGERHAVIKGGWWWWGEEEGVGFGGWGGGRVVRGCSGRAVDLRLAVYLKVPRP